MSLVSHVTKFSATPWRHAENDAVHCCKWARRSGQASIYGELTRGRSRQRTMPAPEGGGAAHDQRSVRRDRQRRGRGDKAPLKLEEFLPYRLNVVASLVSQALSRIYAERYGIGVPEWRVLVTLGQFGTMTAKAIGAHSHMHKTKVSRAVALLERRKLITAARQSRRLARSVSVADAGRPRHVRGSRAGRARIRRTVLEAIDAGRSRRPRARAQRLTERSPSSPPNRNGQVRGRLVSRRTRVHRLCRESS